MSLIRLNQLHGEIMSKVQEKVDAAILTYETQLKYHVGAVAPSNPDVGFRWYDTSIGLMKVFNNVNTDESADWEIINSSVIYLPGKNAVESLANSRRLQSTGSGFIDFGGTITSPKVINRAMLANNGIPRQSNQTTGTEAKEFWFQNFLLINSNGYSEPGIAPSTGEETQVFVNGLALSLKGTKPNLTDSIFSNKLMAVNFPEAPKTKNELIRDELVFLEVWKEKISDTGYVFPFGNVQFTNDDADGISTTFFNGDPGYCESFYGDCLYEDQINSDGTVTKVRKAKGKGWVWKNLKSAFKNTISANFKHNIFVDGDQLVQIRYRMRVVKFAKSPATELTPTSYLGYVLDNDASATIKAQGKQNAPIDQDNCKFLAPYHENNNHKLNGTYSTELVPNLSQDGYVYAIPVALVSRRNQGVFDSVFNQNGSARFRDGIRLVADYDESDSIIGFALMDSSNATLDSSTTGKTWEEKYNIMMGWLFDRTTVIATQDNAIGFVIGGDMNSGISGRYDNLYYDEINERDVKDLRIDTNKQLDLTVLLDREFNKFVLGKTRGWENEFHMSYWKGNPTVSITYGVVTELPIYYKLADGTEIKGIDQAVALTVTNDFKSHLYTRAGIIGTPSNETSEKPRLKRKDISVFSKRTHIKLEPVTILVNGVETVQKDEKGNTVMKLVILDKAGGVYVDENTEFIIASPKNKSSKKTQLFCDIIGDSMGNSYKFSTTQKVADLESTAILENGNIVYTGQNYYVYRGTLKTKDTMPQDSLGYFKVDELDTNTWVEISNKGAYRTDWIMYGNLGTPLVVSEEGKSLLPKDVISGLKVKNLDGTETISYRASKFFKLSKKVKSVRKVIVTKNKEKSIFEPVLSASGTSSIMDLVNSTPGTFAYANVDELVYTNTIMIHWSNLTDDAIIEVYYETDSNPTTLTESTKIELLGDLWCGNSAKPEEGCKAVSNLIDKVSVYAAPALSNGAAKRIPLSTYLISAKDDNAILNEYWSIFKHDDVNLAGNGPAVKILPYLSSYMGEMYLKVVYKELDQTANSLGQAYLNDNSTFNIVNGETVDDNGGSGVFVKVGQRKIKLPYFFGGLI